MPTDLKPGLRVQHPKHGIGSITAIHGDAVEVEHDDDGTVRRYVLALCTLTTLDGDPLAKLPQTTTAPIEHPPTDQHAKPPPALQPKDAAMPAATIKSVDNLLADMDLPQTTTAPIEHPPTDQHAKPPPALQPKDAAMPAATIKSVDNLLADMDTALRERGPEAKAHLAAACGLMPPSLKNWRVAGRIPEAHRDAVRAWLQAPHAKPPKAKATKQPAQRRAAKPAAPPPPADIAPAAPADGSRQLPAPLTLTSIAGSYISYATLLRQLGLDVTYAWVHVAGEDGTMRFNAIANSRDPGPGRLDP